VIRSYRGKTPQIAPTAYIDPAAVLIGDVSVGDDSSVWPGAVLRGDVHAIRIGRRSNIQDNAVLHGMKDEFPVLIEDEVTVGHGAILHGCVVEACCLIGMGAIVLNNARIGSGSIVAAGTLVPEGMVIPPGSLVMGHPATVRRALSAEERKIIERYAERYVEYKNAYRAESNASGPPAP
jgi:carbonic anhydrase/acetyltransferase-like protein (isoleucine patch superfamily)